MKRVGILGGTFNPVHKGHIKLAKKSLKYFNLDLIYFIPTGKSYHKNRKIIFSKYDRISMLKLALKKYKKFILNKIDIDRQGKTYTEDTIKILKKNEPNTIFFLILGFDSFCTLKKWKNYKNLFKNVKFLIGNRKKNDRIFINVFMKKLPFYIKNKTYMIPMKSYNISSSYICKKGIKKNKNKISKKVYEYILNKDLLKNEI